MAKVVVSNIDPRINGEYDLVPIDDWTYDEWHRVKKNTGLIMSDFLAAEETGQADTGVVVAIADVSCERAGKAKAYLFLKNGRIDNIELVPDETEIGADDAGPPEEEGSSSETSNGDSTSTDGESVSEFSGLSVIDPKRTGDRISPTGFPRSETPASSVG